MLRAKHYLIRGLVQGVGYRFFVLEAAKRHGVAGYARNLPNGDVEVHAQADETVLALFKEELRRGPMMAHVTEIIESDSVVSEAYSSFVIRG